MSTERDILIIDGMNIFLRSFMVNQTVNANGQLVGGVIGFLKSIKYLCSTFKPSRMFIVWEQGGASPRRKHIYPEYKANRARQKDFSELYTESGKVNPMADHKNKAYQLQLLTKALGHLPVCQLYLPEIEADDVIAWLCKGKFLTYEGKKVIVSSDKDFYQLLEDPKVNIYDPGKKHVINQEYVKTNFNICPRNIALARCLAGDASDNIDGVPGIGLKTVSKRFKEFLDDTVDLDVPWLLSKCKELQESVKKPPKCYEDILQNEEIVRRNWKLMYLDIGCLVPNQTSRLTFRIEDFTPTMRMIDFLKVFAAADIPITKDVADVPSELKCLLFK